jgi:hypothetical protein
MDDRQRQLLFLRFAEIEAELETLAEGRVVDGDPATVEADLLQELDEIEFTLGENYFERRGGIARPNRLGSIFAERRRHGGYRVSCLPRTVFAKLSVNVFEAGRRGRL